MLYQNSTCPFWVFDDITRCSRDNYLDFGIPLILLLASSLILVVKSTKSILKRDKTIKLQEGETRPLLSNSGAYGTIEQEEPRKRCD